MVWRIKKDLDTFLEVTLIFFVALLYVLPVLNPQDSFFPSGGDFSLTLTWMAYSRDSILKYGQFPEWYNANPPGTPFITYTLHHNFLAMPFIILFGELKGFKILILMFVFFTGISMWYFAKKVLNVGAPARLFAALSLMLCGTLASHVFYAGKPHRLLAYPLIPLALTFLYLSVETDKFKYKFLSAITMALFIFSGENYFFQYFFVLFVLFSFFNSIDLNSNSAFLLKFNQNRIRTVLVVFFLFLMFSAIRLIPTLELQRYMTRVLGDNPDPLLGSESLDKLVSHFFITESSSLGFWEHYAFIGYIIPIFFVLSLLSRSSKLSFLYTALFVFILWGLGRYSVFSVVLPHLPLTSNLRWVSRTLVYSSFLVISLSTLGFQWFTEKTSRRRSVITFFVFLMTLTLFFSHLHLIEKRYEYLWYGNILSPKYLLSPLLVFLMIFLCGIRSKKKFQYIIVAVNAVSLFMVNGTLINAYSNPLNLEQSSVLAWIKNFDNSTYIIKDEGLDTYYSLLSYPEYKLGLPVWGENQGSWRLKNNYSTVLPPYKYLISTREINDVGYKLIKKFEKLRVYPQYYFSGRRDAELIIKDVYVYELKENLPYVFTLKSRDDNNYQNQICSLTDGVKLTPNKIVVDVPSQKNRSLDRLVVLTSFYPGWKVSVDGGRFTAVEDFHGFISTPLSDGPHTYVFEFKSRSVRIGFYLTLLSIFIMVYLLLNKRWRSN